VIDDHVHPFPLEFTPLDPPAITLELGADADGETRRRRLAPGRLSLHLMQRRLATLLGVDLAEAVTARDAQASGDWTGWVRRLFDDADITGMIVDEAVGPTEPARPEQYAELAARPVWHMARIDPLVDHLIADGADAAHIVAAVERFMADAVAGGAVAFKTILAYRTGLRVDPRADLTAAQRSLVADAAADVPVRRRGKALRDLVMRTALARARDLRRPMQVHTGFGDSEIRLADSDPLLLEELLRTPEGAAATVVLIHGSFPWHQKAAYLAASKANVWTEVSLSNLFAPAGVADRLLEILDVAPAGRVLLGSDGHGVPETHWFACRVLREAWESAAQRLGSLGADAGWLADVEDAIFEGNARAVYALGR
jgi:predicted TIM-barrel fold metal-dependent hydrolase